MCVCKLFVNNSWILRVVTRSTAVMFISGVKVSRIQERPFSRHNGHRPCVLHELCTNPYFTYHDNILIITAYSLPIPYLICKITYVLYVLCIHYIPPIYIAHMSLVMLLYILHLLYVWTAGGVVVNSLDTKEQFGGPMRETSYSVSTGTLFVKYTINYRR